MYCERFGTYVTLKANPIFAQYKFNEKTKWDGNSFNQLDWAKATSKRLQLL